MDGIRTHRSGISFLPHDSSRFQCTSGLDIDKRDTQSGKLPSNVNALLLLECMLSSPQMLLRFITQAAYIFFHYVKGTPFISEDQGATRRLTHWEQMEEGGDELATSRKFFVVIPVLL